MESLLLHEVLPFRFYANLEPGDTFDCGLENHEAFASAGRQTTQYNSALLESFTGTSYKLASVKGYSENNLFPA